MRRGFTDFSASKDVVAARDASALAAEILMKWRRFIRFIHVVAHRARRHGRFARNALGRNARYDETRSCKNDWRHGGNFDFAGQHDKAKSESSTMLTRIIPSSGEKLPVIGLGTWQAFDVDLTVGQPETIRRRSVAFCEARRPCNRYVADVWSRRSR